jgi:hypothetical protein
MPAFIDLVTVAYLGRLRRRTPLGDSCLEIAGSGGIWSCAFTLFLNVWFLRECIEVLLPVISWGMCSFHDADGECHENQDLRTSKRWFESGW